MVLVKMANGRMVTQRYLIGYIHCTEGKKRKMTIVKWQMEEW